MSKASTITAATESTGTKIRRQATATLQGSGEAIDAICAVAYLGVAVCSAFDIGDTAGLSAWELTVGGLAAFGVSRMFQILAFSLADALNPDATDGDSALLAATILRQLREDIAGGAEPDSVLERLREAHLGTHLGDLVADLATAYEDEEDHRFADPLWAGARKLRDADRAVTYGEV